MPRKKSSELNRTALNILSDIDGYVGGSLYPSLFHKAFTPQWVDAILHQKGLPLPRKAGQAFTLIDLGCGDGLGLIVQAAAHPGSHFIGVDAIPGHITRGQAMIAELGLKNIELRCETFIEALKQQSVQADYVTVQGVWSWINPDNQCALLQLVTASLKPGGVAMLGYNCLPGWAQLIAFQKLIRMVSLEYEGSPAEKFWHALDHVRAASKTGMYALDANQFEWFDTLKEGHPEDYFAHEYLNGYWQPMWSGDAINAAADHGLDFQCSGSRERLRDDFVYRAAKRNEIAKVANIPGREIMKDMLVNTWFRRDIFSKSPLPPLDEVTAINQRMNGYWVANGPKVEAKFTTRSPAGTLKFDNASAHHILDHLAHGPASLDAIYEAGAPGTRADILNTIDSLFFAGLVEPVDPYQENERVAEINQWLAQSESCAINVVVTPHGPVSIGEGKMATLFEDGGFRQRTGL